MPYKLNSRYKAFFISLHLLTFFMIIARKARTKWFQLTHSLIIKFIQLNPKGKKKDGWKEHWFQSYKTFLNLESVLVSLVRHHPPWIGFTFLNFFRIDSIVSLKDLTVFDCTICEDASSQKKSGPTNHFWCWFFSSSRYFYFSFPIGSTPRKSNHNIH